MQQTQKGAQAGLKGRAPAGHAPSPALTAAKQKIEAFMITQDVTLSVLFNVIDSNSDNQLSK